MEVKLGLERRRILVLGGLKPPGHGDAGRNWAGGLSEAGAAWHVSRSEAKQCDSAPALLLLALPVLLCTHRGCPCHPSLPCVQTSLAARKQSALLPASDRFSAFGAELALVGDWVGGSPHSSDPTSLPPLQLRRQIRECRSYITPPPAQMNVVGVAGGIVLCQRASSCARKLAPPTQSKLKKYSASVPIKKIPSKMYIK